MAGPRVRAYGDGELRKNKYPKSGHSTTRGSSVQAGFWMFEQQNGVLTGSERCAAGVDKFSSTAVRWNAPGGKIKVKPKQIPQQTKLVGVETSV